MILQLLARQVHASFSRRLQPILKESFAQGSLLFLAIHRARKSSPLKNDQCKLHNQSLSRVALAHHVPTASLNHYSQIKQ